MHRLHWGNWTRHDDLSRESAATNHAGIDYSAITWVAMRRVFLDESGLEGLLYNGSVYEQAQHVIIENNHIYHFDFDDLRQMLRDGLFKYNLRQPPLFFRLSDTSSTAFASAPRGGNIVRLNIPVIAAMAAAAFPQSNEGVQMLTYWLGAVILHEIMHNHGFPHPTDVNHTAGSDYASSLPHVALKAVLLASPYWDSFFSPNWNAILLTSDHQFCGLEDEVRPFVNVDKTIAQVREEIEARNRADEVMKASTIGETRKLGEVRQRLNG